MTRRAPSARPRMPEGPRRPDPVARRARSRPVTGRTRVAVGATGSSAGVPEGPRLARLMARAAGAGAMLGGPLVAVGAVSGCARVGECPFLPRLVARLAVSGSVLLGPPMTGGALGTLWGVGELPVAGLLVARHAFATAMLGRRLMARSAVDLPARVCEGEGQAGAVAGRALAGLLRRTGTVLGCVTGVAAGRREIVAAGTTDRDMARDVGDSSVHDSDRRGAQVPADRRVEDTCVLQCLVGHLVPGIAVAALAAPLLGVARVVEARDWHDDLLVAAQTALIRDGGALRQRKARLTLHVGPDLTHCLDLVRESLDHSGIHMAVDAGDPLVRAAAPCLRVGTHFVTCLATEDGLIGGSGHPDRTGDNDSHDERASDRRSDSVRVRPYAHPGHSCPPKSA